MTTRKLRIPRTGLLLLVTLSAGCDADAPRVVLYVSADDHVARPVVREFEQRTGIRVDMVGDTEQKKTTGLVNRLRAESDNPQADVFWSSEVFQTIRLAEQGVLERHVSAATETRPSEFRDPGDRWHGFAARARVIVFAPQRVAAEDLPSTWMELTRPVFKGRIAMADPRFGTTGGHLAAMHVFWSRLAGTPYYEAFLMGLADNGTRLLPSGNAGVVRAVASGEADIGMTDTDDVWAARAAGLDVDLVYARHGLDDQQGAGTLLIPNTVARVRGGPNPAEAARLIDFLLSVDVERMLAESVSHNVPLHPDLAGVYPRYEVPDPLEVRYDRAAAALDAAVAKAMEHLGPPGSPGSTGTTGNPGAGDAPEG